MKKGCLIGGIVGLVVVAAIAVFWFFGIQNNIVTMEEGVKSQWSNVESQYQKRADQVDGLIGIVKGAANFEQETLTQVIEARSKATQTTIDPSNLTPEKIAEFQQAQNNLGGAMSRLLLVMEQYPQLTATQGFRDFQATYNSIEEEVKFERRKFNERAQEYNTYIRKVPNSFVANMAGFEQKGYFEAAEGTENAPKIDFSK